MIARDDPHDDARAWLHLLLDWGIDEALETEPVNRLLPARGRTAPPGHDAADLPAGDLPAGDLPGGDPPARAARSVPADRGMPAPTAGAGPVRDAAAGSPPAAAAALAAAAGTLAALEAAVAGFTRCALRDTAGALVFADGPADARVVLVIDAPSADDDAAGRPLAGEAGAYAGRMLASVGLDRAAVRVATLVPWRPPGDRPAGAAEIAACLPFLRRHLALLDPAVLVIAGAGAARALAGATGGVRTLAGTWRSVAVDGRTAPLPALLLPSPASVRADPRLREPAWLGLLSLRLRLDGDETADASGA